MTTFSPKTLERARNQAVANLYEGSGRTGAFPQGFRCLGGSPDLAGPALTLVCPAASNIWIHKAIYQASPGDVLVIATLGRPDAAYLGDLLVEAAVKQKLGGIVIEGCVRDVANLRKMPLPVFALGTAVDGPEKTAAGGSIGKPVEIGNARIKNGDLIRGDEDGVVAIPAEILDTTLDAAEARETNEASVRRDLIGGNRPLHEILKFKIP